MIISGDDPVSKGAQRFEVFTGAGRRREWPPELKASIVAECCPGRGGVSAVARRQGLDTSQIYGWREDLVKQLASKGLSLLATEPEAAMFVPAVLGAVGKVRSTMKIGMQNLAYNISRFVVLERSTLAAA